MSEGQQRVSALRRQRALLQEQLRKAQEQVYRLSQEEEEQRSLTDKMQRVMAMELKDQEKGNTQRVVNEASRLVRLFTTGFSSETMEPCFMSRDAERIASQRTAQENLRSAIDTFVEHQVQAPLSKARLLQRAAHGDPSKPANGKNSAVGGSSSSSSSGIGQPITDHPHTPGRESTVRETTSATQPSIEEQAYESLRADLRRLQACDWLCAQQLVQARVRAARAKAREQALVSHLHDPQHRNLDDVYRLTAERHAFIEQQTWTNQELREKLHALLREAQALQPTAVQVGSVDAHVRRQQFLLRKTRVALKHQRIERNIHATFHHMLRCEAKEHKKVRELVEAACASITAQVDARVTRIKGYREALEDVSSAANASCLPMHDECGHALFTALGGRERGDVDASWLASPRDGRPIVSFAQLQDALTAFKQQQTQHSKGYKRAIGAFAELEEEVAAVRREYEVLLWPNGNDTDRDGHGGDGRNVKMDAAAKRGGDEGEKEGAAGGEGDKDAASLPSPVLSLPELDAACDELEKMTAQILEDVARLTRELETAQPMHS